MPSAYTEYCVVRLAERALEQWSHLSRERSGRCISVCLRASCLMYSLCAGSTAKTGPSTAANDAPDRIQNGASTKPSNSSPANKDADGAAGASNGQLSTNNTRRRRLSVIPSGKVCGILLLCVHSWRFCTHNTCSYCMLIVHSTHIPRGGCC